MRPANEALIVVDIQNDFCTGGALAVPGGEEIIARVNALLDEFQLRVFTQDWHPADHSSFADNHEGRKPYEVIDMPYGSQILWPVHCVADTVGAAFHPDLDVAKADHVVRKGGDPAIDSYSAFFENDHETPTGLDDYLSSKGIEKITLAGLATDFCVLYSALDANRLGYAVTVLEGACRGIDLNGSLEDARTTMLDANIVLEP
ncbi:bifunctional nicotinamidase/pyrazinamidase [Rhodovulum sp. BSW8]|uniref:Nicotinamidase n=1 Tax=Rhodovulum visakhapatnamense TaxID=364297 RepID=A0A4R8FPV7_9RHOB|nr:MULTISPECIES: bifunctional nicotinamidase/pyrazinamidase [Rhodovulum]OLS43574.1 nicotinamidase [Rhodovulum sulfidophilum]MBL3569825.1 bifunctional nicotinamidase/pyrazinamidase [Rhodovulum visakhapatnamense]MBL3577711.1 bifunctional nicotinamidase/pyrazinamidase [Rhodovulum visakhapatnamense]RBO51258.1 bifunctional nicotinamidase/pyrazinamidase [Rhodovulum sp. BSW8]TDX26088.1 nicotinamidase/pyrazinamidase [Rhodovulum visakhapatnamense]